jgi:APA family basic amino acid/polyamine antiporter
MVLSGTFDQILTYMGFSLGIFPLMAVAGVFKLRAKGSNIQMLKGLPVHLVIYLIFSVMILLLSYLERPVESSIALLTALTGIPFFYYFKKQNHL